MTIDDRTANRAYPKPNENNQLCEDISRLRKALDAIDNEMQALIGVGESNPVTLAGSPNYITMSGQVITRTLVNLATHVAGILPLTKGGTGAASPAAARAALDVAGLDELNTFKKAQQVKASDAETLATYLDLSPTDAGAGRPGFFVKKATAAAKWLIGLSDGTDNGGEIDFDVEALRHNGSEILTRADGIGKRNYIINGDGRINQRKASSGVNDDYAHDRHYALTQSNDIAVSTRTAPYDGVDAMIRLTQDKASAQRMGYAQIFEAVECYGLRGQEVTLCGKLEFSNNTAVRFAILEWTGTADVVTSDVVNDWTSSIYSGGNFFNSSNLTVAAVGTITPDAATLTDWWLKTTLGSSVNNVIVLYWTEAAARQSSRLDMAWGFVVGDSSGVVAPFGNRSLVDELNLCRRYCYVWDYDSMGYITIAQGQMNHDRESITIIMLPIPLRGDATLTYSNLAHFDCEPQDKTPSSLAIDHQAYDRVIFKAVIPAVREFQASSLVIDTPGGYLWLESEL